MGQFISQPATNTQASTHGANIIFEKSVDLDGVTNIIESSDKQILAQMDNKTLQIDGENLNILSLDTQKKTASITGNVISIKYNHSLAKTNFIKKLIK